MGTGINVKTVQAMAFGMPLLTTAWGCKGIETGDPMHSFATLDDLVGGLMEMQSRPEVLEHLARVSRDRYVQFLNESLVGFNSIIQSAVDSTDVPPSVRYLAPSAEILQTQSLISGHRETNVLSVMQRYEEWENGEPVNHAGHAFATSVLARIEKLLPPSMSRTAETGCGKSTILFSNISGSHTVFALDDTSLPDSSVAFYRDCPVTRSEVVTTVFGPTQRTLRNFKHEGYYDCVLIDGPHGWPFPEFEYLMFFPNIRPGGFLLLDDCVIPTIGRMADVLAEDPMWELVEIVGSNTAVFRRTDAKTFDPEGDGWWEQPFNRRRVSSKRLIWMKDDASIIDAVSSLKLDRILHGEADSELEPSIEASVEDEKKV
jgi:hypothetical protein